MFELNEMLFDVRLVLNDLEACNASFNRNADSFLNNAHFWLFVVQNDMLLENSVIPR